ncbi:MAG TPA: hypothetical protein VIU16_11670, partial [Gaiellaceae bacterium]
MHHLIHHCGMTSSEDTRPGESPEAAPRLGTLLIERGLLTAVQLQEALLEQQRTGVPLGQAVVRLGYVSPATVAQALATQHGGLAKTEFGMAVGFDTRLPTPARGAPPFSVDDLRPALQDAEDRLDALAEQLVAAARRIVDAEVGRDRARALVSGLQVRVATLESENQALRAQLD